MLVSTKLIAMSRVFGLNTSRCRENMPDETTGRLPREAVKANPERGISAKQGQYKSGKGLDVGWGFY